MKKFIFTIGFVIACSLAAFSQQMEDVLYLKTGQVVRGIILEQTDDYIKIAVLGKYKFIYPKSEIEKTAKEVATSGSQYNQRVYNPSDDSYSTNPDKSEKNSGYLGLLQIGAGVPLNEYSLGFYKADLINGYRFNKHFSLGVGIGVRHFFTEDYLYFTGISEYYFLYTDQTLTPIFLDARINFSKGKVSPYLNLAAGYMFPGPMGNANVGVKIGTGKKSALHIGAGIEVLGLEMFDTYDFDYTYIEPTLALSAHIGFSF